MNTYEEYKKQRIEKNKEWDEERFKEILQKKEPLESRDIMPFFKGLTQDEIEIGCLIFLASKQERGASPAEILRTLRREG